MSNPLFQRIAIIGVGLLGGSIGLGAKSRGLAKEVIGIGRNPVFCQQLGRFQRFG